MRSSSSRVRSSYRSRSRRRSSGVLAVLFLFFAICKCLRNPCNVASDVEECEKRQRRVVVLVVHMIRVPTWWAPVKMSLWDKPDAPFVSPASAETM